VFFEYDNAKDELEARHASGEGAMLVKGLRITLGHCLSGWVAANRQTIVNSDPALDLGELARMITPQLASCLSTPLVLNDSLVGVLSVYSSAQNAFSDDDRRTLEILVREIAPTFQLVSKLDTTTPAAARS
jgi:GAF domain-containing protein